MIRDPPKKNFIIYIEHNHEDLVQKLSIQVRIIEAKDEEDASWRAEWYVAREKRWSVYNCRGYNDGQDCIYHIEEVRHSIETLKPEAPNESRS